METVEYADYNNSVSTLSHIIMVCYWHWCINFKMTGAVYIFWEKCIVLYFIMVFLSNAYCK